MSEDSNKEATTDKVVSKWKKRRSKTRSYSFWFEKIKRIYR